MQNTSKRMAIGLLSLVLCMGLLVPVSLAASSGFENGVMPHSDRCDICGGSVNSTMNWQDTLVKHHQAQCVHFKYGTDLMAYREGTCYERCRDCGASWSFPVSMPVLVKCGGYIA